MGIKRNFIAVIVVFFAALPLKSQMVYSIESFPDSAAVYFDGELKGYTPLDVRYAWKSKKGGLPITLKKNGYEDQIIMIPEKPPTLRPFYDVVFPQHYEFQIDSLSSLVAFDRIIEDFPQEKILGHKTYVKGSTAEIKWGEYQGGGDEYRIRTYDVLAAAGFRTSFGETNKLFAAQKGKSVAPRFVLGGQLKDLRIDWVHEKVIGYTHSQLKVNVYMVVDWQVLDKATNAVIHTSTTIGRHCETVTGRLNQGNVSFLEAYQMALIRFLQDNKLAELVNSSRSATETFANSEEASTNKSTVLKKAETPKFESSSEMIQAVTPACVTISTDAGHGSGVLVSENGLILTAFHVIEGVNRIEAILPSGVKLEAEIISTDKTHDVALLKIPGSGYQPLNIGDSKAAGLGVDVFTIGTPSDIDLGQSVSKGIVSGKRKIEEMVYIQTDVSVSPGNSGGPLIDTKGDIIGIIQRKLIGNGIEGVGFALPIETVLKVLNIDVE